MDLGTKKFNIMGFTENLVLRGSHEEPIYRGELPKKMELRQFADFGGRELMKKRGVFLRGGGDTPMHTVKLDEIKTPGIQTKKVVD